MDDWDGLPPGEPVKGKTYRADGWVYRDVPIRLSYKMWYRLLEILGEGNYFLLAKSESKNDDWIRGQFLISPQGIESLIEYSTNRKSENDDA